MPKPRRLEIRVTDEIGALIDRARGDAKVQSWGERAFLQRLERDGFLGGSEQTVSVPVDRVVRPESSVLPVSAPSSGPSAATPSDVPEVEPEPAAPEPESHDEPEYERRPPPRMTGGRKAR